MLKIIDAEQQLKSEFKKLFDKTDQRVRASVRHGISEAINKIKAKTQANVRGSWFNSTSSRKYGVGLIEGVKAYMLRGEMSGVVDIMGNTRANDGTWRLRIYEGGSKLRGSKYGKDYGAIRPTWFFKNATASADSEAYYAIEKALSEAISQINNGSIE